MYSGYARIKKVATGLAGNIWPRPPLAGKVIPAAAV